jgi:DNA-binding SARP family transcriptional activator
MEKEISFTAVAPDNLSGDDDLESLRCKRDSDGGLRERSAAGIRQFPALQNNGSDWPVRVYTLGLFSLLLNVKPTNLGRQDGRQPLEFLKTLIALGGSEVSVTSLISALWPDAEGETAQRSFDATLGHLREILGDERLLVLKDGQITLDTQYCWVDAWDFERTLDKAQGILSMDITGKDASRLDLLSTRLLSLYRDHFLAREAMTSWSVSLRERLRNRFLHHLLDVGHYWEVHGFWDKAMQCYQRGIEVDDLIEDFYQRLMACCLETQRIGEGMAVYQRCRRMLSTVLGLKPGPETEALHHSLKGALRGKHTA